VKLLLLSLIALVSFLPVTGETLAYWRFEGEGVDTEATILVDSSGNSNNGNAVSGPIYRFLTPGGFSNDDNTQSLEFDGVDDVVEVADSASLDFSGSFTVEFWMRSPGTGAGQDLIIDKSHGVDGNKGWFFQSRPGTGLIDFGIGNGSGFPLVTSTAQLFDNEWHHLAGTYDGNTIEFFVDGVSQGTTDAGVFSDNGQPIRMGNTSAINRFFKGYLDEVRISNAVLEPADFLFTGPSTTIGYWRFEKGGADTEAAVVADSSSNSNSGSPLNGPLLRKLIPGGFSGNPNGLSLEFDGLDDIVEIPDSVSLDFSGSFTVEFWMRSPGTGAGQDLIIDKSHGFGGQTGWFFQSRPNVGVVNFGMGNGTGFPLISSANDLFDNQWHHLAGTYDGNTIEFFVDGISQGTMVAGVYLDNDRPMRMGNTQSISRYFKGQLDEVRVSNTVLERSAFLLNPFAGSRLGNPVFITVSEGEAERPGIQYNRLTGGVTDAENVYTSEGYSYTVQISSELVQWQPGGTGISYTTSVDNGNGTETITAYFSGGALDPAKSFLRLQVTE